MDDMVIFSRVLIGVVVAVAAVYSDVIPLDHNHSGEKVCHAETVTYYTNPVYHWNKLRHLYTDCNYVRGNLVISFLEDPNIDYDLSFLKDIRYVSGYVEIIGNSYPPVVPLPRLEIIRGNQTFKGGKPINKVPNISLLIGDTSHQQVYMPRLREITSGNVYISMTAELCYLNTIKWDNIVRHGYARVRNTSDHIHTCPPCSRACEDEEWGSHCWGPTDDLCQWPPTPCDRKCNRRCSFNDHRMCCHPQCAIGCTGPSEYECLLCKDFKLDDGACVSHCPYGPSANYPRGQDCASI